MIAVTAARVFIALLISRVASRASSGRDTVRSSPRPQVGLALLVGVLPYAREALGRWLDRRESIADASAAGTSSTPVA